MKKEIGSLQPFSYRGEKFAEYEWADIAKLPKPIAYECPARGRVYENR